ncbi:Serine--tRNA ligase [Paragonimus kellicotti]|nr:Serine--tRNA ligase [Paragonimus kellicotti]
MHLKCDSPDELSYCLQELAGSRLFVHRSSMLYRSSWTEAFQPSFDLAKLSDPVFVEQTRTNLLARESTLNFDHMLKLYERYRAGDLEVKSSLLKMIKQLPNSIHPLTPVGDPSKFRQLYCHGSKHIADWKLKDAATLATIAPLPTARSISPYRLFVGNHLRLKNTSLAAGPRTYYFGGPLAHLEEALISFTLHRLSEAGFALVSVPDILPEPVIEACGFATRGKRSQVYKLCSSESDLTYCLSGTAEMGLAGFCAGRTFDSGDSDESTAVGLCAVSRCFRQEAPHQEPPLYRVHQFTKISSTSNCLDYQSQRLNIRWALPSGNSNFAYTVSTVITTVS